MLGEENYPSPRTACLSFRMSYSGRGIQQGKMRRRVSVFIVDYSSCDPIFAWPIHGFPALTGQSFPTWPLYPPLCRFSLSKNYRPS